MLYKLREFRVAGWLKCLWWSWFEYYFTVCRVPSGKPTCSCNSMAEHWSRNLVSMYIHVAIHWVGLICSAPVQKTGGLWAGLVAQIVVHTTLLTCGHCGWASTLLPDTHTHTHTHITNYLHVYGAKRLTSSSNAVAMCSFLPTGRGFLLHLSGRSSPHHVALPCQVVS